MPNFFEDIWQTQPFTAFFYKCAFAGGFILGVGAVLIAMTIWGLW